MRLRIGMTIWCVFYSFVAYTLSEGVVTPHARLRSSPADFVDTRGISLGTVDDSGYV